MLFEDLYQIDSEIETDDLEIWIFDLPYGIL